VANHDHDHEFAFKTSTEALTTLLLSVVGQELEDPFPIRLYPVVGMALGMLSLAALRHPEWFAGHAQRILDEQLAAAEPGYLDELTDWVIEHAPLEVQQ
jgi:hypothetical protein